MTIRVLFVRYVCRAHWHSPSVCVVPSGAAAHPVWPELFVRVCDASVKLLRPLSAFEKVTEAMHRSPPAAAAAAAVPLTLPSSLPDHHF